MKKFFILALIICGVSSTIRANDNICSGDSLTASKIEAARAVLNIDYQDILERYRSSLTQDNILTLTDRLSREIERVQPDSVRMKVSVSDGIILDYIANVFNMPYSSLATDIGFSRWSQNEFRTDLYIPIFGILAKWIDNNIDYICNEATVNTYIHNAAAAHFTSLVHNRINCGDPVMDIEEISFFWDISLKNIHFTDRILRLMISYYKDIINKSAVGST